MNNDQSLVLEHFFNTHARAGWQSGKFVYLDGWQTVEALWPMHDVFRKHLAQIGSLPYQAAYEAEADQALFVLSNGGEWTASAPSALAWRVLYERHIQSILMALANHLGGNAQLVPVPQSLPAKHHKIVAMLFLQWAMPLPYPIQERSAFPWPEGSEPGSLLRH